MGVFVKVFDSFRTECAGPANETVDLIALLEQQLSQIAAIFTQSENAAHLAPDITRFFQIAWLFLPGVALGMLSGAMFQGAGKGMNALILTLFRTVLLTPLLAWGLAVHFGMGLEGVWWGLVIANVAGSIVSYTWARIYINGLKRQKKQTNTITQ